MKKPGFLAKPGFWAKDSILPVFAVAVGIARGIPVVRVGWAPPTNLKSVTFNIEHRPPKSKT